MACQAVQTWSLSGLVAAFLDLTIVYLLLCASAAAYFASKFLGFLGLHLPCPCGGMFINVHNKNLCFNRLLVEFPIQKLSDVQLSVRQKFPFSNSISLKKYDCSVVGDNCGNGIIELEGDASCSSSISDARGSADVIWGEISPKARKIHIKGKGILGHRPKSQLRNRKWVDGYGKNSSLLSYDSSVYEEDSDSQNHHYFNMNKRGSWCSADGSLPADNAGNFNLEYDNAPKKIRRRLRSLSRDEMDLSLDEDMHMKESMPSGEDQQYSQQEIQSCGGDENNKIRLLEQALERERAARAALYTELEKERSAAASAADEAMAMILRLQKEKASVEMEARQYQRIIEEKSFYDDEEMDILQEILMRREKEKLFLEKEVEAYKEMVSRGNEPLTGVFLDNNDAIQIFSPPNYPNDDPVVFASPTDKKVKLENKCAEDVFMSQFKYKPTFGVASPFQPNNEQSSFERVRDSNEKSVDISIHNSSGENILMPKVPPEFEKTIPCYMKELEQIQELNQHKLADKVISTCYGTEKGDPNYKLSSKQQAKAASLGYCSSCDPTLDKSPLDVHVIGDGINPRSEEIVDKGEQLPVSTSLKERKIDCVQSGAAQERINVNTDLFVKKSSSEVTNCLPPIGRRGSSPSLRRSSMSSLDTEMLKIDSEIIQLRERLKLVKEGREKLSFSLENREKNLQLKILEDIARQIQELRRFTEPQKAARQASLPLPNAKGLSKRRRNRSVSSGFQMSSEG